MSLINDSSWDQGTRKMHDIPHGRQSCSYFSSRDRVSQVALRILFWSVKHAVAWPGLIRLSKQPGLLYRSSNCSYLHSAICNDLKIYQTYYQIVVITSSILYSNGLQISFGDPDKNTKINWLWLMRQLIYLDPKSQTIELRTIELTWHLQCFG